MTRDPTPAPTRSHPDLTWWSAGMRAITWSLLGDCHGRLLDVGCGPDWGLVAGPPGMWGVGLDRIYLPGPPQPVVSAPPAGELQAGLQPYVRGNAAALPFRAGSFDLVLALDLLEQQAVNPADALREMNRVLRPGGRLFARVPAHPRLYGAHDRAWGGALRYRRAQFRMLIEQAGFAIVRMTYANSLAFPFAVLVRLAGRAGVMRDDPLWLARPFGGLIRQGLGVEARILRAHDLPLGLSLVCLAEA